MLNVSVAPEALEQAAPAKPSRDVRAWKIDFADRKVSGEIVTWIVNGGFHPFWNWWLIGCAHLRPEEGLPEPNLRWEGATHEIVIVSLKDGPDIELIEAGAGKLATLTPLDLAYQPGGLDDFRAVAIVYEMIDKIIAGDLSPDSDFAAAWRAYLGAEVERFGGRAEPVPS